MSDELIKDVNKALVELKSKVDEQNKDAVTKDEVKKISDSLVEMQVQIKDAEKKSLM